MASSLVSFIWPSHYGGCNVSLSGTFTNWTPRTMVYVPKADLFHLDLELRPGIYQYKFMVQDNPMVDKHRWCFDLLRPIARDCCGNVNNVIRIDGALESESGQLKLGNGSQGEKIGYSKVMLGASNDKSRSASQESQFEYWNDTYKFETNAKVIRVDDAPQNTKSVVLTNTIFYPQGGGQPSDTGIIKGTNGGVLNVTTIRSEQGVVLHIGSFEDEGVQFEAGEEVTLLVDQKTRVLHARLHSAGHLLDVAVHNLGLNWVPAKGYHFPSGPYVEYQGDAPAEKRPEILKQLQDQMTMLVSGGGPVEVEIVKEEDLQAKCKTLTDYPKDQPFVRVVTVGGLGCPCGGTHVKEVKEINEVKVTKISSRKGTVRVSYKLTE